MHTLSIQRVLVPIDWSADSRAALDYARALAKAVGAELTLVHVVDPHEVEGLFRPARPQAWERALADARGRMRDLVGEVDPALPFTVLEGRAADLVADHACAMKADLIVTGAAGAAAGLRRLLVGSTTERLVKIAPCPVLVVREETRAGRIRC